MLGDADFLSLLLAGTKPARRRLFVSYHHAGDQAYYDAFSSAFHDEYETIFDNSVDRLIDSDNTEYIMRRIREGFISGTSCTVVLCGLGTPWRKYVDWEIRATLDKQHGLIGVRLPTVATDAGGNWYAPDRLVDNLSSGYASWITWGALAAGGSVSLVTLVERARARPASFIVNNRTMMARNGAPPWQR